MRRLIPLLFLTAIISMSATARAAEPVSDADREVPVTPAEITRIVTSANPDVGFSRLSPRGQAEAAAMIEANLVASAEVVDGGPLSARKAAAVGLTAPRTTDRVSAAVSSGCWYHYYFTHWTLWNIKTASSWMQLNWCGRSGAITSWSLTNVGGSATLLSYDGNTRGATNVGWEVRGVTTHKFSFHLGSVTKCMQVRGGATGLYSRSVSCSVA